MLSGGAAVAPMHGLATLAAIPPATLLATRHAIRRATARATMTAAAGIRAAVRVRCDAGRSHPIVGTTAAAPAAATAAIRHAAPAGRRPLHPLRVADRSRTAL